MAITDIRAVSTLNGVEVIQGSVGDSFATGGGWITTTGQVTVLGLHSFSIGQLANINTVPRILYVLGVAPDPYSNTTIVTVGCRLSLLKNQVPDPDQELEDLEKDQCEADVDTYSASGFRGQGLIVDLSTVWSKCMTGLGLSGSLSSQIKIHVDKKEGFDFSAGYLKVAEDILISEAKFAYADGTTIRLIDPATSGIQIYDRFLLDLSASSTTDVPKKDALIRYETIEIQPPEEDEQGGLPEIDEDDGWSRDEAQGDEPQRTKYIRFDGGETIYEYNHDFISYTLTETEYNPKVDPPENPTCEEKPYEPSKAELISGKVKKRVTKNRVTLGNNCQAYCEFLISAEADPNYELTNDIITTETYSYDDFGELIKVETVTTQPQFMALSDLPNLHGAEGEWIQLSNHQTEVSKTVVEYTNVYENGGFENDRIYLSDSGERFKLLKGRRTKTSEYAAYFKTNNFRHRLQVMKESLLLQTIEDITWVWNNLVFPLEGGLCKAGHLVSANTVTESGSELTRYEQARPTGKLSALSGDRVQSDVDTPEFTNLTKSEKFTFSGHDFGEGYTEHTVPYTGHDYYERYGSPGDYQWTKKEGDRANLSRCAQLQHRMAFGRTAAFTAVIPASMSPSRPLFSARIENLTAQFICAGMTWQLSNSGAVAALDLVLWSNTISGNLPSYPNPINTVWDVTYNSEGAYLTASQISEYLGTTEWYVDENNTVILDPSGTGDYSGTAGNLLLPDGEVAEGNLPPVWIESEEIQLTTSTFLSVGGLNHELTNYQETVDLVTITKNFYGPGWLYPQAANFVLAGYTAPYIIDRYLPADGGSYLHENAADGKFIQYYDDLTADGVPYTLTGYEINARKFNYELTADMGSFVVSYNANSQIIVDRYIQADGTSLGVSTLNNLIRATYQELFSFDLFNGTTNPNQDGMYSMTEYTTYSSPVYGSVWQYYIRFWDYDSKGRFIHSGMYNPGYYTVEWGPDKTIYRVYIGEVNDYTGYLRFRTDYPGQHDSPYGTDDLLAAITAAGMGAWNTPPGIRFLGLGGNLTQFLVYHGSFGVSGGDITTLTDRVLTAAPTTFTISGQDSGRLYSASTEPGVFTISGQDSGRLYSASTEPGVFAISGQSIDALRSELLVVSPGSFSAAGQAATFVYP